MAPTLCGSSIQSNRSLLATGWFVSNTLVFISFLVTITYSMSYRRQYEEVEDDNNNNDGQIAFAVITRAMVFVSLWTVLISIILGIFGSIVLGFQIPFGRYYWCFSGKVLQTSPLVLGIFIGSMLMFANLTLVCSFLFGNFEFYNYGEEEDMGGIDENQISKIATRRTSLAFSMLCMFLTLIYAGSAAIVFHFSSSLLEENRLDLEQENEVQTKSEDDYQCYVGDDSYINQGESFRHNSDNDFLSPSQSEQIS
mmetsp:Transcript_21606/g.30264  ORF Transcript_21606/g.30264 Transcript_21606/m.30264 type:complete len:253 (-) Transcript_21606:268-1026(-)